MPCIISSFLADVFWRLALLVVRGGSGSMGEEWQGIWEEGRECWGQDTLYKRRLYFKSLKKWKENKKNPEQ